MRHRKGVCTVHGRRRHMELEPVGAILNPPTKSNTTTLIHGHKWLRTVTHIKKGQPSHSATLMGTANCGTTMPLVQFCFAACLAMWDIGRVLPIMQSIPYFGDAKSKSEPYFLIKHRPAQVLWGWNRGGGQAFHGLV